MNIMFFLLYFLSQIADVIKCQLQTHYRTIVLSQTVSQKKSPAPCWGAGSPSISNTYYAKKLHVQNIGRGTGLFLECCVLSRVHGRGFRSNTTYVFGEMTLSLGIREFG